MRDEIRDEDRREAIAILMNAMKWTAEQTTTALNALNIPENEHSRYLAKL